MRRIPLQIGISAVFILLIALFGLVLVWYQYSLLLLALRNRQDEVVGALELVNARDPETDRVVGFSPEAISYDCSMSSQAAISLDNRRFLQAQKGLLDALIQLIAGAIEAKSPYTSDHCQRVPELAPAGRGGPWLRGPAIRRLPPQR